MAHKIVMLKKTTVVGEVREKGAELNVSTSLKDLLIGSGEAKLYVAKKKPAKEKED